jgi:tRNA modification GTPase
MKPFTADDPIAALATPWGESALGVIRISGKDSLEILNRFFHTKPKKTLSSMRGHTIHYGFIHDGDTAVDEVMTAVYHGVKSYTGEESAEIYCHGGMAVIQRILNLLYSSGFRPANPGEFTLRAFLNGKMDLTRAEAVNEIIRSKTDKARALALDRLSGKIESNIRKLTGKLTDLSAALEVCIDYPDEDIPEEFSGNDRVSSIEEELLSLLATYRTGKIFQEGVSLVIGGRTNSGKSTLFNLLLKEDRAIVSDIHGTTRDYIEGNIAIEGIPIRLYDTAGLRTTDDKLEQEGMQRTDKIIKNARLMLFLVDATLGLQDEDKTFMAIYSKSIEIISLWNKIDLKADRENTAACPEGFLPISAETGRGLSELHMEIARRLFGRAHPETAEAVIDSDRQKRLLENCLRAVRSFRRGLVEGLPLDILGEDIREALACLGEITGEVTTDDILRKMFSRFCVGK